MRHHAQVPSIQIYSNNCHDKWVGQACGLTIVEETSVSLLFLFQCAKDGLSYCLLKPFTSCILSVQTERKVHVGVKEV